MEKYTLKELCEEIYISMATGRNWIKSGKLNPVYEDGKPYFSKSYVQKLKDKLSAEDSGLLRSRRNKKYISGQQIYEGYISIASVNRLLVEEVISQFIKNCQPEDLEGLLAYYAEEWMAQRRLEIPARCMLMSGMTEDSFARPRFELKYPWIHEYKLTYEEDEDILGLLYISCKHMGERKTAGAYYTPSHIVRELVSKMWEDTTAEECAGKKILDPSCGTGNFLLQLPNYIELGQIYGCDIDRVSVGIARINLALKYRPKTADILFENIKCIDYLMDFKEKNFDYIIGNPPWGAAISSADKECYKAKYETAQTKSVESYDLFVEKSLKILSPRGKMAFLLPEAIMTVKTHSAVRELIIQYGDVDYVAYLGNIFYKVQCPSVILLINKKTVPKEAQGYENKIITIKKRERTYEVHRLDRLKAEGFDLFMTDYEYEILGKLYEVPHVTLKGNATFAMGIVTGDNRKYITDEPAEGFEPVISGKDVEKYTINEVGRYINYVPAELQQVASEDVYRAKEKLVYRFIGDTLRFAYDESGCLTLNSCNIVIPHIEGLDMRYIMAVLNSSVAEFIYTKKFRSMKLLRGHIEAIPIPVADKEQQNKIINMIEQLKQIKNSTIDSLEGFESLRKDIDKCVVSLFMLNRDECLYFGK